MDVRFVESESQSLEPTFCSKWQKKCASKKVEMDRKPLLSSSNTIMAVIFVAGATDNGTAQ